MSWTHAHWLLQEARAFSSGSLNGEYFLEEHDAPLLVFGTSIYVCDLSSVVVKIPVDKRIV